MVALASPAVAVLGVLCDANHDDRGYEREGTDEVDRGRDQGDAVGVWVDTHSVGDHAAVVSDREHEDDRCGGTEERGVEHRQDTWARLAETASDEVGTDGVERVHGNGDRGEDGCVASKAATGTAEGRRMPRCS